MTPKGIEVQYNDATENGHRFAANIVKAFPEYKYVYFTQISPKLSFPGDPYENRMDK